MVFQEYVRRSVRRALTKALATQAGLPVEQREQALQTLTFALDAIDAWPEARDLLVALAPKLDQAGWREEVVPYLLRGIDVSKTAGDDVGLAELRLQLAMVHLVMGKLDEAYGELIASAADFDRLDDRRNRARRSQSGSLRGSHAAALSRSDQIGRDRCGFGRAGDAEEAYGDFVAATLSA